MYISFELNLRFIIILMIFNFKLKIFNKIYYILILVLKI